MTAFWRPILLVSSFLALLTGCGGLVTNHLERVDEMLVVADSVTAELNEIDPATVNEWYVISATGKSNFLHHLKNDTLNLEQGKKLDAFLWANRQLKNMVEERRKCQEANSALKKRLQQLRHDIANGAGDRSDYEGFVKKELTESKKIRMHCRELKQRYADSKTAIEQFQEGSIVDNLNADRTL